MTKREEILQKIHEILNTVSGANIYRSRTSAFLRDPLPAINFSWTQDLPQQTSLPFLDWSLQIKISVIVRGTESDSAADSYIAQVHSKLMQNAELNNLCINFLPTLSDLRLVQADQDAGVVSMDYVAQYRTNLNDLESN